MPFRKQCLEQENQGIYKRKNNNPLDIHEIYHGTLKDEILHGVRILNETLGRVLPSGYGSDESPL